MSKILKPTEKLEFKGFSVFLAGTIDNGNSIDWQKEVTEKIKDFDITILNPRRDDWDSTKVQSIHNPQFKEQVEWELRALEKASVIFMMFLEKSLSPITLLELGLFADKSEMIIVCPDGFWRKGNVEIVAKKYGQILVNDLETGINLLKERLCVIK